MAHAATKTFDGGTGGTGTTIDTAGNWSPVNIPITTDEALFNDTGTLPAALPSVLTTSTAVTFGDLIWNSTVSSSIEVTGSSNRVLTLSGSGGSTAASAAGGTTGDLLVMGSSATGTLTIGGNAGAGTGQLFLAIGKAGNFDVANSGATLDITAAISGAFGLTKTGAGTLILAGANSFGGTAANFTISTGIVQLSGAGTLGSKFTDLVVNANLDLNGTNQNVDALSGSSSGLIYNNASGTTATLTIGNDNGGGTFSGVIADNTGSTGTVALTKIGIATATINSTQTYSGSTTVNLGYIGNNAGGGALALSTNAGQLLNSDVTVNGATFTATSSAAGTITRAKSVTLNDATMTITGNSAGNSVETITNALTLGGGRSTISLVPNGARNAQFAAASLVRSPGATALVRGSSLGLNAIASAVNGAGNISFATAPTLSGSGSAGTSTVGILPWAYGDNSNNGNGTDFLTYDATNGLRRLTASEYVTTFADGNSTLANAKIASVIGHINSATALNSLTLGTLGRVNGTGTLTIGSGGILAIDNSSIGTIEAGTLDFGTSEGILLPIAGKALSIGSTITGSGGLTAGGAGTAILTGTNSYTGGTNFSGGVLNINGDAALGAVPGVAATNLTFSGGTLQAGATNVALASTRNIATTVATVNAGFDTNGNAMSVAGSVSGIGGINKLGNGVLTLSGTNSYTGPTFATRGTLAVTGSLTGTNSLIFEGGEIRLDFSGANAPASNIVNSLASLAFNIGPADIAGVNTLTIQGKNNAASSQTFSSTNFANFASHINLAPGSGTGTLTVNLGTITRNTPTTNATTTSNPAGATFDITIPAGVTVLGSSGTNNGVIIGATVNGNTWATVSGGNIAGYSSYSTSYTTTAATNLDATTSGTLTADLNSIRFNTAAANTVTLGGTSGLRALGAGEVLVTSAVGANLSKITGGYLQGLSRRDIIFIQNNTLGDLEVDSIITDLGGIGSPGLTKSGAGRLILAASNNFSGPAVIDEGTVVVTGDYLAPVTVTGNVANGGTQITGIADTTGIFLGEKVTNGTAMNSAGVSTTWVVIGIDSVNGVVTVSNPSNALVTAGSFAFSGGGGLGATTTNANSVALGATLQIGNNTASGSLFVGQTINSAGSVVFDRTDAFSFANVISGTGSVTQEGSGPLTLTGGNTYTGATNVAANSTLIAGASGVFGTNSPTTVAATGTLELAGKAISFGSLAGGGNVENDSATAASLTIGGDNTSPNFSGALRDGTGGGALSVTKTGAGTQTLSGANTFTGTFSVNGGTANISGGFTAPILAGGAPSTTGIVNILTGAAINANVTTLNNSLAAGAGSGSLGAIYQSGGDVIFNAELVLGGGGGNAYGFYDMTGGTLNNSTTDPGTGANERFRIGGAASNSVGVFYQSGGAVTLANIGSSNFEVGGNAGGPSTNATGVAYLTGGTFVAGLANHIGVDGSTGAIRGEETIAGTAQVTVNGVTTLGQTSGDVGILNLDGGVYAVKQIVKGTSGTGIVNFNGGTLKAAAASTAAYFSGLTSANVYSGGGTVDTNGQNITIGQSLLAPAGNGVTTIAVAYGGVGFIGAPYIAITGGGGTGATAVANMVDDGSGNGTFKIASITITNPGTGYTGTPTIAITGGGGNGAIIGAVTTVANTSGGFTKIGAGTLTLNGTNTYTGATNVNQGTLLVGGSLAGSVDVNNSGSTLGGTGTIVGATVDSGAILLGGNGTTATGTLTSSSDVSLDNGSVIKLTLGASGAHSSIARTGGTWVFDSDQAFSFTLAGATFGTYDNIITGLTGTEAGLDNIENWTIVSPGVVGTFAYDGNGGVDFTYTAVPEPGALTALLGGFGTLLGLRRFRRRRF